jgi:hypothetical protein
MTRTLFEQGLDSDEDVAAAETQLDTAIAQATDVGVARAEYEHAIAVLIGVPPGKFSIPYEHFNQSLPVVPVSVPSDLLERRPDIAAAERQVAQTNAQIGVARAALLSHPLAERRYRLRIHGSEQAHRGAEPDLVGGPDLEPDTVRRRRTARRRDASTRTERGAGRDLSPDGAGRVPVRGGPALVAPHPVAGARAATTAGDARRQAHGGALSIVRYRNGVDSYVNVITAENAFLSARETELQVRLRQLTSSVSLINDLGGGWAASQLGETERMAKHPPDAGKEPMVPADNAGPPTPNPPGMPAGEIEPDDFIKLNNEAVGPSS